MFESKPRVVFEFTLPAELKQLDDDYIKTSFGLVKLLMDEEISATGSAGRNPGKVAYNMTRCSLVEVDGRRLNKGDAEDDTVLNRTDPQIRAAILHAYNDISDLEDSVGKKLLASRKMKAS
jgi:hypothetical protein